MLPYQDVNGNGQVDAGERCSIYNGAGWAASADTDYPDEAWSLIEWLCNYDNQVKQAELGVTMAGYKGALDNYADAFEGMDIDAFLQMENEGTLISRPCSKYTTQWETRMGELLVGAWNDPSTMEAVCRCYGLFTYDRHLSAVSAAICPGDCHHRGEVVRVPPFVSGSHIPTQVHNNIFGWCSSIQYTRRYL